MTLLIKQQVQLAGYYRLQVMREGKVRQDTGWFPNLITDQGLIWIGQLPQSPLPSLGSTLNTHVGVGTGTATPAFTDTRLAAPLAMCPDTTGGTTNNALSYTAGTIPYWSCIWTYQYTLGDVVGNISEVGVGNTASTDTDPQLFSRSLILDGLGNPTTISVTALDVLVVTYELRYYIATGDNTYSMVISGVTYTGTYRRMLIGTVPLLYRPLSGAGVNAPLSTAYKGFALGPITGTPTFTQVDGNANFSYAVSPYTIGSGFVEFTTTMPLNRANFTGGITGFATNCNHGQYQFSISPAIPKTSSYILSITWRVYWSRYP